MREKFLSRYKFKQYWKKLNISPLVCEYCQVDFEYLYGKEQARRFLELHEVIDANSPTYIKIKADNFKVICPNCHKLEHVKMRHYHGQPGEED